MKTLLKLLRAFAIASGVFFSGIVLAVFLYPDTDTPDWYIWATIIIPVVSFILSLRLKSSSTKVSKQSSPEPSLDNTHVSQEPPRNTDSDSDRSGYYFRGVTYSDDAFLDILQDEENWREEQRDINQSLNGSPDSSFADQDASDETDGDISPDDDFVEDSLPQIESPDFSGSFLHIAGLPLQIGTFCTVSHFPDHLEIFSPTHRHYLAAEKISTIIVLSYKDLIKLHDDLAALDADSTAFITLSEAIDISSKKKHLPTQTRFLLMTYRDSEAEPQSIVFQLNDGNLQDAIKFTSGSSERIRPRVDL